MRDDEARFAPRSQGCCKVGSGVDRLGGDATLPARSPKCRSKKREAVQKRAGRWTAAMATKNYRQKRRLTFGRSKEQEASMKKADEGRERRGACPRKEASPGLASFAPGAGHSTTKPSDVYLATTRC
jgi:hypothetical protein